MKTFTRNSFLNSPSFVILVAWEKWEKPKEKIYLKISILNVNVNIKMLIHTVQYDGLELNMGHCGQFTHHRHHIKMNIKRKEKPVG